MPFNQSLNALKTDRGLFSITALVVTILILLAWSLWFFFAPIPVYETGKITRNLRDGRLAAYFPAHILKQLRPGQTGYIHLDSASQQLYAGQQTATISQISSTNENGQIEVILFPEYHENGIGTSVFDGGGESDVVADGGAWVTVAVEQLSPATLVLRSSGQFLETAPISLGSR